MAKINDILRSIGKTHITSSFEHTIHGASVDQSLGGKQNPYVLPSLEKLSRETRSTNKSLTPPKTYKLEIELMTKPVAYQATTTVS